MLCGTPRSNTKTRHLILLAVTTSTLESYTCSFFYGSFPQSLKNVFHSAPWKLQCNEFCSTVTLIPQYISFLHILCKNVHDMKAKWGNCICLFHLKIYWKDFDEIMNQRRHRCLPPHITEVKFWFVVFWIMPYSESSLHTFHNPENQSLYQSSGWI